MNIAILIYEELNGSTFSYWSSLLEELISNDKCNIYIIVDNNNVSEVVIFGMCGVPVTIISEPL